MSCRSVEMGAIELAYIRDICAKIPRWTYYHDAGGLRRSSCITCSLLQFHGPESCINIPQLIV